MPNGIKPQANDKQRDEKFANVAKEQLTLAKQTAEEGNALAAEEALLTAWDNMRSAYDGKIPADKSGEFGTVANSVLGNLPNKDSILASFEKEKNRDPDAIKKTRELLLEAHTAASQSDWKKFKTGGKVMHQAYMSHVTTYRGDVTNRGFEKFRKAAEVINTKFPKEVGKTSNEFLGRALELSRTMTLPSSVREDYRTEFAALLIQTIYDCAAFQAEHRTDQTPGSYVPHGPLGMAISLRLPTLISDLRTYLDPAWVSKTNQLFDDLRNEIAKSSKSDKTRGY